MNVYSFPHLGKAGRLGNQLWQVAATAARAAREPESRASIPADWEYRPFVSVPEAMYVPPLPNETMIDMAYEPGGPYYQELEYIAEASPMLKTWFAPSELIKPRFAAHHERILDEMAMGKHFTAIHVRRGDYVQHADRFPPLTPRYWYAATEAALAEVHHTTFLLFSDDVPWCYENAGYLFGAASGRMEFISGHVRPIPPVLRPAAGEPLDIFDLWLMQRCKAHIIANSSFSWWAAYLADEWNVWYPDRWFGDPALFDRMFNCIPPEWRQLPC